MSFKGALKHEEKFSIENEARDLSSKKCSRRAHEKIFTGLIASVMFEYAQTQMLPKLSIVGPSPLVILHEAGYLQKSGKNINSRHSFACVIN